VFVSLGAIFWFVFIPLFVIPLVSCVCSVVSGLCSLYFVVDLGVYSKGMDVHNVPDVLGRGIKHKASGYEYMRSRQESAEAELEVEKREKDALLKLLEHEK
jgi:hypothetical protein